MEDLKGPILNSASRQSKYASAMLKIINDLVLNDIEYVNRLKMHYKLFKKMSNKRNAETKFKDKIGRNELCSCGSGRKYKQCCGK